MPDFMTVLTRERSGKKGGTDIYPAFLIKKSRDLMIRGQDFYAVWLDDEKRWSTDEQDALDLIDNTLDDWYDAHSTEIEEPSKILYTKIAKNGIIDDWHKYVMRQMRDNFKPLDEKLIFANTETKKTDYSSMRLPYSLQDGPTESWDKLFGTLYSPTELHKLEWGIGSVATGASKTLQKFFVLYGSQGSGKGTFLKVLSEVLFPGYAQAFASKLLGQANNQFPLQDLKDNPLIAFDMDGRLDRIEDNTRLNTLVSHEKMTVNLKGKQSYEQAFKTLMFIGSNEPVKITNAKSGLLRRLIDVSPTGQKVPKAEYNMLLKQISFEAGAIVSKCKKIFEADPNFYDDYVPEDMMSATNDFYTFVLDQSLVFEKENGTTLRAAWGAYKEFCDYAKVPYPLGMRAFKEELKNYFQEFEERHVNEDGSRIWNYYSGFIRDKFQTKKKTKEKQKKTKVEPDWLIFKEQESILDKECADCPAQYAEILADGSDKPQWNWDDLKVTLSMLDTHRLHYLLTPWNLITVDFDIPDETGKKNFELNRQAIIDYGLPPTYAELSKSGQGIHLEYYYDGDISKLSSTLGDHVEIKFRIGNSSLRRMLTKCNNLPIATISGGLPLKEVKKTVTKKDISNQKHLRSLITKALNRELKDGDPESNHTKTNIEFIDHVLAEAQEQGIEYDIHDLFPAVVAFASSSTNNALYCMKLVRKMHFVWPEVRVDIQVWLPEEEQDQPVDGILPIDQRPVAFFDVEVFPNLFIVCWKEPGPDKPVHRMINPTSAEVEALIMNYGLIGFNNRKYDNHILLAASQGYSPKQLFKLSKAIITDKQRNHLFSNGYGISKTDLYDLSSKKQSLKKYEIELSESGVPHKELGLDWNEPVPENLWDIVADYCCNDVLATEAVYNCKQIQDDLVAREILSNITGMRINDTTNQLTTRFIFGNNREPQDEFNYRNLAEPVRPS